MSLSRAEFVTALSYVSGTAAAGADNWTAALTDGGCVTITFTPLANAQLSALLQLPRALVRLTFDDASEMARRDFLARFDFAFQRGGG